MRQVMMLLIGAVALVGLPACGDDDEAVAAPFELSRTPEFVNMVIPGRRPLALVTAAGEGAEPIRLSATTTLAGGDVEIAPSEIVPGGVAEIWVDVPETSQEIPFQVTIGGDRGAEQDTITVDAMAMPGTDDLEPTALDIADVFLDELGGRVDGLPASRAELVNGTPIAGLLVVSHYAWFTEEAELDLAWHVMIAPDDWAELTLRPRDQLAPTEAYRLSSWSTALAGGDVTIETITPPPEITR